MGDLPGIFRQTGPVAPGSARDIEDRKAAGMPAYVYRLRFIGRYIRRYNIMERSSGGAGGLLISEQVAQNWRCTLVAPNEPMNSRLPVLLDPCVVQRHDDGRLLLAGTEWDEGYLRRWPQTWLVGKDKDQAYDWLGGLEKWLEGRFKPLETLA